MIIGCVDIATRGTCGGMLGFALEEYAWDVSAVRDTGIATELLLFIDLARDKHEFALDKEVEGCSVEGKDKDLDCKAD